MLAVKPVNKVCSWGGDLLNFDAKAPRPPAAHLQVQQVATAGLHLEGFPEGFDNLRVGRGESDEGGWQRAVFIEESQ